MRGIDAQQSPSGFIVSDLLRPVQDGHGLAVGHPLQHLGLVKGLDEPEGEQR